MFGAIGDFVTSGFSGGNEGPSYEEQMYLERRRHQMQTYWQRQQLEAQKYLQQQQLAQQGGQFQQQFQFGEQGRQKAWDHAGSLGRYLEGGGIDPQRQQQMISQNWQSSVQPQMGELAKYLGRSGANLGGPQARQAIAGLGVNQSMRYGQQLGQQSEQQRYGQRQNILGMQSNLYGRG